MLRWPRRPELSFVDLEYTVTGCEVRGWKVEEVLLTGMDENRQNYSGKRHLAMGSGV